MQIHNLLPALAFVSPASAAGVQGHQPRSDLHCHLSPPVDPARDGLPAAADVFAGHGALLKQVERHGAIVKIPSVSYDDNGEPGDDPRWEVFHSLHRVLEAYYPIL